MTTFRQRELFLSPDHAVLVNGVLIPVKLLTNDGSITQVERSRITYYHVELPEHAVILADGLPVESYLETGDRANFHRSRNDPAVSRFQGQTATGRGDPVGNQGRGTIDNGRATTDRCPTLDE